MQGSLGSHAVPEGRKPRAGGEKYHMLGSQGLLGHPQEPGDGPGAATAGDSSLTTETSAQQRPVRVAPAVGTGSPMGLGSW